MIELLLKFNNFIYLLFYVKTFFCKSYLSTLVILEKQQINKQIFS